MSDWLGSNRLRLMVLAWLWGGSVSWGAGISGLTPAGYDMSPAGEGVRYHTDSAATIASVPRALAGGTLIRTATADAGDPVLNVTFEVDVRSEVYVCYERGSAAPSWLSSWVRTGMSVGVSDEAIGHYEVYARRFAAGTVTLSANEAEAMYFVVVKESLPAEPRNGWVLLSYDMRYLREIITKAPEYDINHIQISHDVVMYTFEVLEQPSRRADINELIDLAHAYGVTDVTLWTHEMETHGMPTSCYVNYPSDMRVDGDKSALWAWLRQRYAALFSPGTGCPELDGIVVTFSELHMFGVGVEVYDPTLFRRTNSTAAQNVAKVLTEMKSVCDSFGKGLYARTWAGIEQYDIRDGIQFTGDTDIWMMNKNVGDPQGISQDWQFMDSHNVLIGSLSPAFRELIEFDLCGEYLGRSQYTFVMTSYLKDHWNHALARGVDGATARIDREGSPNYHTANRINLYALKRLLADAGADAAEVNRSWCDQYFWPEAAQDIADHYDAPGTPWEGDTRYMTWEAHAPGLAPLTTTEALSIGAQAIERIDRHRAQLELQTTLDTRDGKTDYETLRHGVALAMSRLGGTVPQAWGFSNFQTPQTTVLAPDCRIDIRLPLPGLKHDTVSAEYSTDGGVMWAPWAVSVTGGDGSTQTELITAAGVPFNQVSEDASFVRFRAEDMGGRVYESGRLRVIVMDGPGWSGFAYTMTPTMLMDCAVGVTTHDAPLDSGTAAYEYSTDGGKTWVTPETVMWPERYECDVLPLAAGWALSDGRIGYEHVDGGVLVIHDDGTQWGDKVRYSRSWSVDPATGATVLARMRCPNGGHFFATNLMLADSAHSESLYLDGCGMIGLANFGALAPVDTWEWHTYRVTIQGEDIRVYLDENPRPVISGNGAFIHGGPGQALTIGSGASQYTQEIHYDYIYWSTAGAVAPDAWREAGYEGDAQNGTLTATGVPFDLNSTVSNRIRFRITDTAGRVHLSPIYNVPVGGPWADLDRDEDVDQEDFGLFQACLSGAGQPHRHGCERSDTDGDGDVDAGDLQAFLQCMAGPGRPPGC